MGSGPVSVTERLVDFARNLRFDDISPRALEVARHCVLDWFGTALAGSREPLAALLIDEIVVGDASREASLVGRSERAGAMQAALVNGAASHALDFDDTHIVMSGHPSAPVIPAALALAEREDASGRAFLTAVVAGIELECRLGAVVNPSHYDAGFHATGTLGTFGAAAAAAHLLDSDRDKWLHALGLAGTQAAGLKASFGTMAKPLHAGKAAANGLLSALLARRGFTAHPGIVEAEQGFAATQRASGADADVLDGYTDRFLICDTLFKYHAACYLTHAAIEGALKLRDDCSLRPSSIRHVELEVPEAALKVCNIAKPATGLEGKFSLRATTAMVLLGDDTADPAAFTDERMASAELVALVERVGVVPVGGLSMTQTTVIIETADGRRLQAAVDTGIAAADLEEQGRRLRLKFLGLAAPVVGDTQAEALRDVVARVEELPSVRELATLATPDALAREIRT